MKPPPDTLTKMRPLTRPASMRTTSPRESTASASSTSPGIPSAAREVVAGAERDDAKCDLLETPGVEGDAVERLVEGAVAAGDEQLGAAVIDRPRRGALGIAGTRGDGDLDGAKAVRERRAETSRVFECAIGAGHRIDD